jgi:hypothetical protein
VFEDALETDHGAWALPEEAGIGKELIVADGEPVLEFGETKTGKCQEVLGHLISRADRGDVSCLRSVRLDGLEPGAMLQLNTVEK